MTSRRKFISHLVAFIIVAIWGSTFVFTKLLLIVGLSPAMIYTLRFIIAYILLLVFQLIVSRRKKKPFRLLCSSWRDELTMAGLGLTGGTLYFLSENAAMLFTTATNTSLIVCSCPLLTMIVMAAVYHDEKLTSKRLLGSIISCVGMAVVVLNGHFVLHLSPIGDMLAFGACVAWALYSLLIKHVTHRYSTMYITRKVFFYGLVTILPYHLVFREFPSFSVLCRFDVLANLLFLSCVASLICFVGWNWVIRQLGAVDTTNWVYFNPITTIIFAWWILNEVITPYFLIGTLLILTGMYLADSHSHGDGK